jgi:hypothetical protein
MVMNKEIFFKVCYLTLLSVPTLYSVNNMMIKEYGAVGGMRNNRRNRGNQRKPVPVPLRPP